MIRALKIVYLFPLIVIAIALCSCADKNTVVDQNTPITNHNWTYGNKVKFDVNIDNPKIPYSLYFNLRITADYRYSNIFIMLHQSGPSTKDTSNRLEFKLANTDGEWYGTGSGNLYSYQMLFLSDYKFPAKGIYHFTIEQNMRDNPLHEVSDVGLRVEKAYSKGN
jgi:gliding motility-associated lipoprotein GldH